MSYYRYILKYYSWILDFPPDIPLGNSMYCQAHWEICSQWICPRVSFQSTVVGTNPMGGNQKASLQFASTGTGKHSQ